MRYHFEKPIYYESHYGEHYECNHSLYSHGTLYKIGEKGIVVIQQRFDPNKKITWWDEIDPWITDPIYLHPSFRMIFDEYAKPCEKGLYPTMTVRQIMWSLKMKPLPKERWETVFDRKDI